MRTSIFYRSESLCKKKAIGPTYFKSDGEEGILVKHPELGTNKDLYRKGLLPKSQW
jgi:hypothetical protein